MRRKEIAANVQGLQQVGQLNSVRPATELGLLKKFLLKLISFKNGRTKLKHNAEPLTIALPSAPTCCKPMLAAVY
jgi:hypothetical protein